MRTDDIASAHYAEWLGRCAVLNPKAPWAFRFKWGRTWAGQTVDHGIRTFLTEEELTNNFRWLVIGGKVQGWRYIKDVDDSDPDCTKYDHYALHDDGTLKELDLSPNCSACPPEALRAFVQLGFPEKEPKNGVVSSFYPDEVVALFLERMNCAGL